MSSEARALLFTESKTLTGDDLKIRIEIGVEGLLSSMAIAPVFSVKEYKVIVTPDANVRAGWRAYVELDLRSLEVTSRAIAEEDRKKILTQVHESILKTDQNPFARMDIHDVAEMNAVNGSGYYMQATLDMCGQKKAMNFLFMKESNKAYCAKFPIKQTDYGIKPTSAFAGALRTKDEVMVEVCWVRSRK